MTSLRCQPNHNLIDLRTKLSIDLFTLCRIFSKAISLPLTHIGFISRLSYDLFTCRIWTRLSHDLLHLKDFGEGYPQPLDLDSLWLTIQPFDCSWWWMKWTIQIHSLLELILQDEEHSNSLTSSQRILQQFELLGLQNEYLMNKLSRNNITTIWGLYNMFKVGLELLEMSLNRLGKQKSRYIKNLPVGASSLVGPDVLPISPDVRYCSYSTRTFSNLQKRPNNSILSSQWPPTVIYG